MEERKKHEGVVFMPLPQDPMILLSYVNTKLRDEFPSLRELCLTLGVDEEDLCRRMKQIDYEYDSALNRFV